jgi:hypothetical protein
MEQSLSWEANSFSASQEIPRILLNPKFNYRIYRSPPNIRILSQTNKVHVTQFHFLKVLLISSSHLRFGLPKDLFPPVFPTKILYAHLRSPYVLRAPLISFFLTWSPE